MVRESYCRISRLIQQGTADCGSILASQPHGEEVWPNAPLPTQLNKIALEHLCTVTPISDQLAIHEEAPNLRASANRVDHLSSS